MHKTLILYIVIVFLIISVKMYSTVLLLFQMKLQLHAWNLIGRLLPKELQEHCVALLQEDPDLLLPGHDCREPSLPITM